MGRPSFRSASVSLRGAGFGDSSALKVSDSFFLIHIIDDRLKEKTHGVLCASPMPPSVGGSFPI